MDIALNSETNGLHRHNGARINESLLGIGFFACVFTQFTVWDERILLIDITMEKGPCGVSTAPMGKLFIYLFKQHSMC
jgi:hypothetical protein